MANEDGRVQIVYNGEIFNHAAIRPELEAAGHPYRGSSAMSPLDTERTLPNPNMRSGDLLAGALSAGHTGNGRAFDGAGEYRGFPRGLYLRGGSSHPGGNITGLPGYNCAKTLLADLGLQMSGSHCIIIDMP